MPAKREDATSTTQPASASTSPSSAAGSSAWPSPGARARAGCSVLVLDRGELGAGASHVAAGMLAPVTEADAQERAAARARPARARAAGRRSPPSCTTSPASTSATAPAARSSSRATATRPRRSSASSRSASGSGCASSGCCRSAARRLEPALAPDAPPGARTCPTTTRSTRGADVALAAPRARRRRVRAGARCVRADDGARVDGLACGRRAAAPSRRRRRRAVVGRAAAPDEARVPCARSRARPCACATRPAPACCDRVLRCEPAGYLVPRGDGRYVLGATVEERGFDTAVTAGGVHELLRDAAELLPGILELEVEELARRPAPRARPTTRRSSAPPATERLVWATGPLPQRHPAGAGDRRPRRRRAGRRARATTRSARALRRVRGGAPRDLVNGEPPRAATARRSPSCWPPSASRPRPRRRRRRRRRGRPAGEWVRRCADGRASRS